MKSYKIMIRAIEMITKIVRKRSMTYQMLIPGWRSFTKFYWWSGARLLRDFCARARLQSNDIGPCLQFKWLCQMKTLFLCWTALSCHVKTYIRINNLFKCFLTCVLIYLQWKTAKLITKQVQSCLFKVIPLFIFLIDWICWLI